jgi:hypothetical protein
MSVEEYSIRGVHKYWIYHICHYCITWKVWRSHYGIPLGRNDSVLHGTYTYVLSIVYLEFVLFNLKYLYILCLISMYLTLMLYIVILYTLILYILMIYTLILGFNYSIP